MNEDFTEEVLEYQNVRSLIKPIVTNEKMIELYPEYVELSLKIMQDAETQLWAYRTI